MGGNARHSACSSQGVAEAAGASTGLISGNLPNLAGKHVRDGALNWIGVAKDE
jgi:hypothetical protein